MKNILIITICSLVFCACDNTGADKKLNDTIVDNPATSAHNHPSGNAINPDGVAHAGWTMADYADSINKGLIAKDTMKGSPHRVAMANIGSTHVHIRYSSPGVKNRIVWGGLVPYDAVWVTGAHQATVINFSRDVVIAGKEIPAGSYAFFTIPGKEKWIAILNTRFEQHLADEYNKEEDLLRVELKPASTSKIVGRLSYNITSSSDTTGFINIEWEKIRICLPVSIKK